jgi:site-specific DNA-methyltransferase (adenine-specific)
MDLMAEFPDKYFKLAICDPPYFEEYGKANFTKGVSSKGITERHKKSKYWDIPDQNYFNELVRVSKNQIIWGINYFNFKGAQGGCIVWDKKADGVPFSEGEIAYTSAHKKVVFYRQLWMGAFSEGGKRTGIHPCEKPVRLYRWLLENYAQAGDKILDTHLGSMSIAIACHYLGFDLTGSELDKDYYEAGIKRVREETKQIDMFG